MKHGGTMLEPMKQFGAVGISTTERERNDVQLVEKKLKWGFVRAALLLRRVGNRPMIVPR